jgi:hypothetical protein
MITSRIASKKIEYAEIDGSATSVFDSESGFDATSEEQFQILTRFAEQLASNTRDLPPDFAAMIADNLNLLL